MNADSVMMRIESYNRTTTMPKHNRSSLDPRHITAPTRLWRENRKESAVRYESLNGEKVRCCRCKKIWINITAFNKHVCVDHRANRKSKDKEPRLLQGGLPSLGKKRR
jgi:uncharacterized C2H2 Zn-finger protein